MLDDGGDRLAVREDEGMGVRAPPAAFELPAEDLLVEGFLRVDIVGVQFRPNPPSLDMRGRSFVGGRRHRPGRCASRGQKEHAGQRQRPYP